MKHICLIASMSMLVGCGPTTVDNDFDPPVPVAEVGGRSNSSAPKASGEDARRQYAGVSFMIPGDWVEQQLSAMQASVIESKYTIPHDQGNMEITLTTMGGGAQSNISRWIGQISLEPGEEPTIESKKVGDKDASWADVRGTFNARVGEDRGPHKDWRLVGIVIPNRPKDFTIKLVGPRQAMADYYEKFQSFLDSAKYGG